MCKDNVTCISGATFLCDNTPDCPHGDDEENCDTKDGHFGFRIEEIKPRNCTAYEFRCLDNICISKDLICDGVEHCMDGTDETPEVCKDITVRNVLNLSHFLFIELLLNLENLRWWISL